MQKKDFPIVCQRFTTSKLKTFTDLESIATYGFRGEALASISHIAHITIASAVAGSPCAFTARFSDGVMVNRAGAPTAQPTACAGSVGTRITVEDMFFNVPTRLAALRSTTEEYRKVLDVVQRYAVHAAARNVGFTCKKRRGATADVRTLPEQDTQAVIGTLYGAAVAAELRPVAIATPPDNATPSSPSAGASSDAAAISDAALFSARGLATHGSWSAKSFTLILFINHRLVQCSSIKRAIEAAYAPYLPKNRHPFVYLSVELPPATVDVNVHPTKREVHFLHEDEIVGMIHDRFAELLQDGNQSRSFATQSALPFVADSPPPVDPVGGGLSSSAAPTAAPAPSHKVRVDARDTHMGDYFSASQATGATQDAASRVASTPADEHRCGGDCDHGHGGKYTFVASYVEASVNNTDTGLPPLSEVQGGSKRLRSPSTQSGDGSGSAGSGHVARRRAKRCRPEFMKPVELDSVRQLLRQVALETHPELRVSLAEHAFVGLVDGQRSVIQAGTKLLLVSHTALAREMFYQQALRLFANTVAVQLQPPAPLEALLLHGLRDPSTSSAAKRPLERLQAMAREGAALLLGKAPMLREYFGVGIQQNDAGCPVLASLPRLVDGHTPESRALPELAVRLAWGVQWHEELPCFRDVANVLAVVYSRLPPMTATGSDAQLAHLPAPGAPRSPVRDGQPRDVPAVSAADVAQEYARAAPGTAHSVVADVLFPALRRECAPSKALAAAGGALQVACTQQLYRIFERC